MITLRTTSLAFVAVLFGLLAGCGGGGSSGGGGEATALCADGWVTHSAGAQGACSSHGGLAATTPPIGSTSSTPTAGLPTAVKIAYRSFKKPIISGLSYENKNLVSPTGITDDAGQFPAMDSALQGNIIVFSVGGIVTYKMSELNAMSFTLADLYQLKFFLNSGISDDGAVQNLMAFLMAIDDDGDALNGIQINASVRAAAAGMSINFNQAASSFYGDAGVQSIVSTLSSKTIKGVRTMPTVAQAISALK